MHKTGEFCFSSLLCRANTLFRQVTKETKIKSENKTTKEPYHPIPLCTVEYLSIKAVNLRSESFLKTAN